MTRGLLLPLIFPPSSSALIHPTVVSTQGAGCPTEPVSATIDSDGTTVAFGFDKIQAHIGPGYPLTEKTKTCTILLRLGYPL